ncbi:MAG: PQQ-binding-like beta-propeller repeat protein [Candidatus Aminicenantes bacterium]
MLSSHLMAQVKKIILWALVVFLMSSCSIFRRRAPSYPSGIFFPVKESGEVVFQGRVNDHIEKEGNRLYFSTRTGVVYCLDGIKREVVWERKVSDELMSHPSLGAKNIYVYDRNSTLYCLSKEGSLNWKIAVADGITSGILEFASVVCIGMENGTLHAFDTTSGKELWKFQADEAIRSTPVFAGNRIVFGCDDHNLYILSEDGNLIGKIEVGGKIQGAPLIDKNSVYFGSDDNYFYCFNLKRRTKRWKIKTGGKILTSPVVSGKRILFLCWNNVVYCLKKRGGHILWWQMIPSRSFYRLEVSGERVIVSSLSSVLMSFDVETGEKAGEFDAKQEIRSNPVWFDPFLLISLYEKQTDRGKLLFLKKIVRVSLRSSKQSPQKVGEEVSFSASIRGFFMPKYEFYLKEGEERVIVQEASEKNSWAWFPEKAGDYVVGVRVFDEKENVTAEIPFIVQNSQELK